MPVGGQHVVVPMSHILALWLSTCTLVGKLKSLKSLIRQTGFGLRYSVLSHLWLWPYYHWPLLTQKFQVYHFWSSLILLPHFFPPFFLDLEMCSKCKDKTANLVMVVWFHCDFVNHWTDWLDWILTSFWSFTELWDHHNNIRMIIIIIHFVVEVRTGQDCCHSQFLHSTSKWLCPI